ncbi:bacterial Peptidase A24 N-domain family [Clostridium bornimense]|uniref:Bacterial Peptidase A24 N-domain family n=1 Tax=Clostridium bornimense TaxID=1216932 RepID=W6SDG9_9CLOT|nr:A24 family peptidase [Clostridium bornimense]CDM67700.1 bacterial Peptidase A24 N-domain family [Clostridium bornimense]
MYTIFVIIIGLVIGSFLNVCIYRIEKEESIVTPSSHCMKCGHVLKWFELIPVLSYLFLKGRCRSCGEKISIRYPIIEIFNSILYLILYIRFGFTIDFFKFAFLSSLLLVIGVIDYDTTFVYTSTIRTGIIGGIIFLVLKVIIDGDGIGDNILGFSIGFIIIFLIVVITKGMGEGDYEIAAVSGLFLGSKGIILTLFLSIVLGGIVATILLIRRKKGLQSKMAFGPYIALATVIAAVWGEKILEFYMLTI